MIRFTTIIRFATRTTALCGLSLFLAAPLAFAFDPNEGAEPIEPVTRSNPAYAQPAPNPMPKINFTDMQASAPVASAPVASAAIALPTFPPVDEETAQRAALELGTPQNPPVAGSGYIAPAPLIAFDQRQTPAEQPSDIPAAAPSVQSVPYVAAPEVAYAPAPEGEHIADATKRIASTIPSKIDMVSTGKKNKLSIKRITPDLQELATNKSKVETFDSTGLSIKVRRPGLDTNFELERAYNALMGGDTTQAIATYKNILTSEPKNEDALFGLASTYHRAGDIEQARPYYGELLKINPNHREGLNNFLVLMSDESPQESLAELDRLEERNPDFSPIPAQQAAVLAKLGYADQAREKMLRAIDLAPDNLTYKYNLAIMLDRQGHYTDAAALYRMLIDASLKGAKVPSTLDIMQKRLNYIATASVSAPASPPANVAPVSVGG